MPYFVLIKNNVVFQTIVADQSFIDQTIDDRWDSVIPLADDDFRPMPGWAHDPDTGLYTPNTFDADGNPVIQLPADGSGSVVDYTQDGAPQTPNPVLSIAPSAPVITINKPVLGGPSPAVKA